MTKVLTVKIDSEDDKEIISYGFALLLKTALNIISTIILGILFELILESIIFILAFSTLRTFAGGYHCSKAVSCYFVSCGIVAFALAVVKFMPMNLTAVVGIICLIVSASIIVKYAPVEAVNKPLDKEEKIRYRKSALKIWIIQSVLAVMCIVLNLKSIALTISLSIFLVSILLTIKQRKTRKIL